MRSLHSPRKLKSWTKKSAIERMSSHHKSGNDTEQTTCKSKQEAGKEKALRKAVVVDWYTANASPNNYLTIFDTPY